MVFKTPITVYYEIMIKKRKDEKKIKQKKNSVMFLYFILPWLFTALQVEIQFALGERIKIIYEYIIKNLKYRKMHTHVDSYA